jgi:regulator of replication initiation timing
MEGMLEKISIGLAGSNGYPVYMVKNNIMANIAIGLTMNSSIRKEIEQIYVKDKRRYYEAAKESAGYEHIIITMGGIEQEIYAKKALGIVICAEEDFNLRGKIIQLIRKYYPEVHQIIKNGNRKLSIEKYMKLKGHNAYKHSRVDGSLLVYLSSYHNQDTEVGDILISAFNDINRFENSDPITSNLNEEIEMHKEEFKIIKSRIKKELGSISKFGDILEHKNESISNFALEINNLFTLEKLDVEETFGEVDSINLDSIIIAYIKRGYGVQNLDDISQLLVAGVFIKLLLKEYRKTRNLFFEYNKETLYWEIDELDVKVKEFITENLSIKQDIEHYKEKVSAFDTSMNDEMNKLKKEYDKEIMELKRENSKLKSQIEENENSKLELNGLRELIFEINNEYIPKENKKCLHDVISDKKIFVIGGNDDWRSRINEKYPNISAISGFNEGFDTSILAAVDFIFFYTGYMNHGTYYKAINFIRNKKIAFGYIGKTNIELVESEMIDILKNKKF